MRPILLLGLGTLLLLACKPGLPDLRIEHAWDSVTVHLETLGEYPTSVGRLLLEDVQSGQAIWEVRRSAGTPQLWRVDFRAGENPSQPSGVTGGGFLQVFVPEDESSFFLTPGREYKLTVWSEAGRSSRTVTFELRGNPEPTAGPPPS